MNTVEHQFVSRCLRCGRKLSSASGVAAGYGRYCARLVRVAAVTVELTGFAQTAREKAAELIATGGVVPARFPGVFRTVSSSGRAYYLTHSAACNCPAGLHGLLCYHVAAVRVITDSQTAASPATAASPVKAAGPATAAGPVKAAGPATAAGALSVAGALTAA